jgi:xanthine dehydrogenase accessory factor
VQDVILDIERWFAQKEAIALATVIETWGSSPRTVGAKMAVTADGDMTGSVSGGCVEGAVAAAGLEVLSTGVPKLLEFGVADETAWEVGLACGGRIEVFVREIDFDLFYTVKTEIENERTVSLVTVLQGEELLLGKEWVILEDGKTAGVVDEGLDEVITTAARQLMKSRKSQRVVLPYPANSEVVLDIFVDVMLPSPTLVIIGGVHIAIPLVNIAKTLGYKTIVIDPRKNFGTSSRFTSVDSLVQTWPDEALNSIDLDDSTAVVVLSHDPKIDDPGLKAALPSKAFYVGALGSRKTQEKRRERLLNAGLTSEQIDRLHAPIGLALGGRSPEEIALSVMAEIVRARYA